MLIGLRSRHPRIGRTLPPRLRLSAGWFPRCRREVGLPGGRCQVAMGWPRLWEWRFRPRRRPSLCRRRLWALRRRPWPLAAPSAADRWPRRPLASPIASPRRQAQAPLLGRALAWWPRPGPGFPVQPTGAPPALALTRRLCRQGAPPPLPGSPRLHPLALQGLPWSPQLRRALAWRCRQRARRQIPAQPRCRLRPELPLRLRARRRRRRHRSSWSCAPISRATTPSAAASSALATSPRCWRVGD